VLTCPQFRAQLAIALRVPHHRPPLTCNGCLEESGILTPTMNLQWHEPVVSHSEAVTTVNCAAEAPMRRSQQRIVPASARSSASTNISSAHHTSPITHRPSTISGCRHSRFAGSSSQIKVNHPTTQVSPCQPYKTRNKLASKPGGKTVLGKAIIHNRPRTNFQNRDPKYPPQGCI
jgi:hypothetical protein